MRTGAAEKILTCVFEISGAWPLRDTSRLDYFRVSPLEVSYDLENDESDYYVGGSSHNGQQQSSLTGNFDTSDLHLDDGTTVDLRLGNF
ncbi:hypothetical protein Tco_0278273 [Tanacetum coccineum]